jgi:hypothetical protein
VLNPQPGSDELADLRVQTFRLSGLEISLFSVGGKIK